MVKNSREHSTVSQVQGIEKPMRRSEVGWASHCRLDTTTKYFLDYDPSRTTSRNRLESFQNILLLTN